MNREELYHFGIMGQKWGIRRYQNPDGSLTEAGRKRYYTSQGKLTVAGANRRNEAFKVGEKLASESNISKVDKKVLTKTVDAIKRYSDGVDNIINTNKKVSLKDHDTVYEHFTDYNIPSILWEYTNLSALYVTDSQYRKEVDNVVKLQDEYRKEIANFVDNMLSNIGEDRVKDWKPGEASVYDTVTAFKLEDKYLLNKR